MNHQNQQPQGLTITVHKALAGDLIHVRTPCQRSVLIDCGYHKGNEIRDDILDLHDSIHAIILTHQHLDHFATAAKFINGSTVPPQILHSGVAFPAGHIPRTGLSTCPHYDGLEQSLWLQYSALVQDECRWQSVQGLEDVRIYNPLGLQRYPEPTDDTYHALNRTATPVIIEYGPHRILIGSDIEGDQLEEVAAMSDRPATLFVGSSHGRPSHNPDHVLVKLDPKYICLTDSFEGSDFTEHFRESRPESDIRSVNIDGTQRYTLYADGAITRQSMTVQP